MKIYASSDFELSLWRGLNEYNILPRTQDQGTYNCCKIKVWRLWENLKELEKTEGSQEIPWGVWNGLEWQIATNFVGWQCGDHHIKQSFV